MSQIEDMSAVSARLRENRARLALDDRGRREHDRWIEIALQRDITQPLPRLIERHAPIDADYNLS